MRPIQIGFHFEDSVFKCIFWYEIVFFLPIGNIDSFIRREMGHMLTYRPVYCNKEYGVENSDVMR